MSEHITLHSTPGYSLEGRITKHTITGATVELFATYPNALHPRAQRIACLTLPPESFGKLAQLFNSVSD